MAVNPFARTFTESTESAKWRTAFAELLEKAAAIENRPDKSRVSDFSDWVFNQQHPRRPWSIDRSGYQGQTEDEQRRREQARRLGEFAHNYLSNYWNWYQTRVPKTKLRRFEWVLEFTDPHDGSASPYSASRLQVAGRPLRGVPDVVLRHRWTNERIVIERKVTSRPLDRIEPELWANLRVQLWCYSWLDAWADAPEVYLIGQVWRLERRGAERGKCSVGLYFAGSFSGSFASIPALFRRVERSQGSTSSPASRLRP